MADSGIKIQNYRLNKKEYHVCERETDRCYGIIPLGIFALIEQEPIRYVHNGKDHVEKKASDSPVKLRIASLLTCEHNIEHEEGQKYSEHSDKLHQGGGSYVSVVLLLNGLDQSRKGNAEAKEIAKVSKVNVEIPAEHRNIIKNSKARNASYDTERAKNRIKN